MTHKHEDCLALLEEIRWGGVPRCPYCESIKSRKLKNEQRYQCNECFTSYSVTVGTLFHKTHIDLEKWFLAIHIVLSSKKSISGRKLSQALKVNKNTGVHMIARIHKAMTEEQELIQKLRELSQSLTNRIIN
jgi:transposase-like protein